MSEPVIKVARSGVVASQVFRDAPDGDLFIAEGLGAIPFDIKRVYFINALANPNAVRGKHAHRRLEQVIFCVNGSFKLCLDDGEKTQGIQLSAPTYGVRLGPMLWHTMTEFSPDCVIAVVASDHFDAADYIREYELFRAEVAQSRP
ncbi:MAG: FdtA/QdtA family cupin domain-containing protein [Chthoniobacterales bacterium]